MVVEIEHRQARLSMLEFKKHGFNEQAKANGTTSFDESLNLMTFVEYHKYLNANGALIKKLPKMVNHQKNIELRTKKELSQRDIFT